MLKWIGVIVIVFAAGVAGFLAHLGMFSKLAVSEQKMGPYVYAYEEFTGPYQKTMPVFARVNALLSAEGVKAERGLGVYFDNPSQVSPDKLRSNCGSIIEDKDISKIPGLAQKLKIGTFSEAECAVVEFPAKSMIAYMIAPMKVYPVLSKYMADKGYKVKEAYELYDMPNKKILYIIPIVK